MTKLVKTPITYYGGKQNLVSTILPLIPNHVTYTETFVGGGAVFWAKQRSEVEVINDCNRELINFYECVQNDFVELEKLVRISLHSRSMHNDAVVVYNNPHMFDRLKRAWAIWVLASLSFSSKLDGSFGYDITKNQTTKKLNSKKLEFTIELAERIQNVQIECTDALRVIRSRDYPGAFHYVDPPYFNSNCGHYDGYTIDDFENLLKLLSEVEGKFLLSSYPSEILTEYTKANGWSVIKLEQKVSVANGTGNPGKKKIEVLTANYDLKNPKDNLLLF